MVQVRLKRPKVRECHLREDSKAVSILISWQVCERSAVVWPATVSNSTDHHLAYLCHVFPTSGLGLDKMPIRTSSRISVNGEKQDGGFHGVEGEVFPCAGSYRSGVAIRLLKVGARFEHVAKPGES